MEGMSLTSCLFRRRYSAKGTVVKKISLINKSLIHLIDDIFWDLGFKNETQAEKVIVIIRIILITYIIRIICIILIISIMSQVRVEFGIADHVWQEKRAAIAGTSGSILSNDASLARQHKIYTIKICGVIIEINIYQHLSPKHKF